MHAWFTPPQLDATVVVAIVAAVASLMGTIISILSRRRSDHADAAKAVADAQSSYAQAQKTLADAQESLQQQLMEERVRVGKLHETLTGIEDELSLEKRKRRENSEAQAQAVAYIRAVGHWVGELCPRLDLTGMPPKPHLPDDLRRQVEAQAAKDGLLTGAERTLQKANQQKGGHPWPKQ